LALLISKTPASRALRVPPKFLNRELTLTLVTIDLRPLHDAG
jgi:hypothetical protein